jgi:hypothetical protein
MRPDRRSPRVDRRHHRRRRRDRSSLPPAPAGPRCGPHVPGNVQIVLIDEPRALAQPQGCLRHVGRRGRQLRGAVAHRRKAELKKVEAFPPHRDLDDAVQLAQRERRRHQHAPPYHRADPDQPDLDLKGRLGIRRRRRAAADLRRELLQRSYRSDGAARPPSPRRASCSWSAWAHPQPAPLSAQHWRALAWP